MLGPLGFPQTGKSDSVRSCVRAGEAKLREGVSEECSSTLGLRMETFPPASPSPPSSHMGSCVLRWFRAAWSSLVRYLNAVALTCEHLAGFRRGGQMAA